MLTITRMTVPGVGNWGSWGDPGVGNWGSWGDPGVGNWGSWGDPGVGNWGSWGDPGVGNWGSWGDPGVGNTAYHTAYTLGIEASTAPVAACRAGGVARDLSPRERHRTVPSWVTPTQWPPEPSSSLSHPSIRSTRRWGALVQDIGHVVKGEGLQETAPRLYPCSPLHRSRGDSGVWGAYEDIMGEQQGVQGAAAACRQVCRAMHPKGLRLQSIGCVLQPLEACTSRRAAVCSHRLEGACRSSAAACSRRAAIMLSYAVTVPCTACTLCVPFHSLWPLMTIDQWRLMQGILQWRCFFVFTPVQQRRPNHRRSPYHRRRCRPCVPEY